MEGVEVRTFLDSTYRNKKIFVTGHTGFKGSWFITWLNLLGAKIKGYALPPEDKGLFNVVASHIKFENVFGDIRDKVKLNAEIDSFEPDFIFHFAAQPLVIRSYSIPSETFEVNTIGTANLLESVAKLDGKCTLVIVTTDKVYENRETGHHYNEDDVLGGYDPYSASKACTEIVVSSFRNSFFNISRLAEHNKAIATARAGNVIGGGDWNQNRIIPDIVNALTSDQSIPVRNPKSVRPWQHVLEPLHGYLILGALLNNDPDQFSGAYNFGPEANDHLSVKELLEIAISSWGKGKWVDSSSPNQLHEAGLLMLDISKAKRVLKWQPKLKSAQAIEWTIDWYRKSESDRYNYTVDQITEYNNR